MEFANSLKLLYFDEKFILKFIYIKILFKILQLFQKINASSHCALCNNDQI